MARPLRHGGGKRRDANEPEIKRSLEALGCRVFQVSTPGGPDLVVRSTVGRWVPLEVKGAKGTLTPAQAGISWAVVRTVDEAIAAVFA